MARRIRSMSMDIVQRGAAGANRRSVTIAANNRARSAPELELGGLQFDNYRRNPVVMWAHDAVGRSPSGGLPIGRTLNISRAADGGIVAEFEFLDDDPFAQRIRNAWDKGFLQAASISWLPLESRPSAGGGLRDIRSELLEWSIVSVPADPDALRESHRRMLNSLLLDETRASDTPPLSSPDGGALAITPSAYEGLTAALAALTRSVEGIGATGLAAAVDTAAPPSDNAAPNADADALAAIRALAADTKRLAAGGGDWRN